MALEAQARGLTPQQESFVNAYLKTGNATYIPPPMSLPLRIEYSLGGEDVVTLDEASRSPARMLLRLIRLL